MPSEVVVEVPEVTALVSVGAVLFVLGVFVGALVTRRARRLVSAVAGLDARVCELTATVSNMTVERAVTDDPADEHDPVELDTDDPMLGFEDHASTGDLDAAAPGPEDSTVGFGDGDRAAALGSDGDAENGELPEGTLSDPADMFGAFGFTDVAGDEPLVNPFTGAVTDPVDPFPVEHQDPVDVDEGSVAAGADLQVEDQPDGFDMFDADTIATVDEPGDVADSDGPVGVVDDDGAGEVFPTVEVDVPEPPAVSPVEAVVSMSEEDEFAQLTGMYPVPVGFDDWDPTNLSSSELLRGCTVENVQWWQPVTAPQVGVGPVATFTVHRSGQDVTAAVVRLAGNVWQMTMRPSDGTERLDPNLGYVDLSFGDPEFDLAFQVTCSNREAALVTLSEPFRRLLLSLRGAWEIEMVEDRLILVRAQPYLKRRLRSVWTARTAQLAAGSAFTALSVAEHIPPAAIDRPHYLDLDS